MFRLLLPLAFMVSGFAMGQNVQFLLDLYMDRLGFVHPKHNPNLLPPALKEKSTSDLPSGQCILSLESPLQEIAVQGMDEATVTWTSIFPDKEGQWNHLLSCSVGCHKVRIPFDSLAPPMVDFRVCGTPWPLDPEELTRCKVLRVRYFVPKPTP